MGFRPIETLSCLTREDKRLRLTCPCGHTAEPDIMELRGKMNRRRGGFWAKLTDLPQHLHCGQCGSKSFRIQIIPALGQER